MKKIVITGGLGYIGTELCKIYSGYSWNDKILVIDNRFISERVNQIRNWNMEFVEGDILDKELIKKYCSDADVVHHLAGITDVPRVKSESNDKHDQRIKDVAEQGTQNILDVIKNDCKIIMPSSHVVYEGINEVKFLICIITTWVAISTTPRYPENKKQMCRFHQPRHSNIAPYIPTLKYDAHSCIIRPSLGNQVSLKSSLLAIKPSSKSMLEICVMLRAIAAPTILSFRVFMNK